MMDDFQRSSALEKLRDMVSWRAIAIAALHGLRALATAAILFAIAVHLQAPWLVALSFPLGVVFWQWLGLLRSRIRIATAIRYSAQFEVPEKLRQLFHAVVAKAAERFPRLVNKEELPQLHIHGKAGVSPVITRISARHVVLIPAQMLQDLTLSGVAFALAHEVAHYCMRKSWRHKIVDRAYWITWLVIPLAAIVPSDMILSVWITLGTLWVLVGLTAAPLSRTEEADADLMATENVFFLGLNPLLGADELFCYVVGKSTWLGLKEGRLRERRDLFLNTHPAAAERIRAIRKTLSELGRPGAIMAGYGPTLFRRFPAVYLRRGELVADDLADLKDLRERFSEPCFVQAKLPKRIENASWRERNPRAEAAEGFIEEKLAQERISHEIKLSPLGGQRTKAGQAPTVILHRPLPSSMRAMTHEEVVAREAAESQCPCGSGKPYHVCCGSGVNLAGLGSHS